MTQQIRTDPATGFITDDRVINLVRSYGKKTEVSGPGWRAGLVQVLIEEGTVDLKYRVVVDDPALVEASLR